MVSQIRKTGRTLTILCPIKLAYKKQKNKNRLLSIKMMRVYYRYHWKAKIEDAQIKKIINDLIWLKKSPVLLVKKQNNLQTQLNHLTIVY